MKNRRGVILYHIINTAAVDSKKKKKHDFYNSHYIVQLERSPKNYKIYYVNKIGKKRKHNISIIIYIEVYNNVLTCFDKA